MDGQCKLAHDLNNVFAIISGHIDFLSDYSTQDPRIEAHVSALRQALNRAAALVHDCQCARAFDEYMASHRDSQDTGTVHHLHTKARAVVSIAHDEALARRSS